MSESSAFHALTPDIILSSAEKVLGLSLEPHITPYNSYINRVYALRDEEGQRFVTKFYRPDRWTADALRDEHLFLLDCLKADIPVVAPVQNSLGETLFIAEGISFSIFPFKSGRTFDITGDDDYLRLGSLIGRVHSVSKIHSASHRLTMDPVGISLEFCKNLRASDSLHPEFKEEFLSLCTEVLERASPLFHPESFIRIHGDCHRGNILDRMEEGLLLIDFDDMMNGPAVHDLWLLLPDHLQNCRREMNLLLEGYNQFSPFDESSLVLVEYLRFMRILYFLSWCEAQKNDTGFSTRFPDWGSRAFWIREMEDLKYQAGQTE